MPQAMQLSVHFSRETLGTDVLAQRTLIGRLGSTISMMPLGHLRMQAVQPRQRSRSTKATPRSLMAMAWNLQASTHTPQPMQPWPQTVPPSCAGLPPPQRTNATGRGPLGRRAPLLMAAMAYLEIR